MAPSGNVISFEDAKRIASSKSPARPSVKTSKKTQAVQKSREQAKSASRPSAKASAKTSAKSTAKTTAKRSSAKSATRSKAKQAVAANTARPSAASSAKSRKSAAPARKTAAKMPAWMSEPPADEERLAKYAMDGNNQYDAADAEEIALSPSELRRKKRAKEKASRQFTKQFGSDDAGSGEAGTRAAVYKAEMGKEHKRAFGQMGGAARSGAAKLAGGISRKAVEPGRMGAPRFVVWGSVVVCLLAVCVFIYPAAQQYYIEMRDHDRLQAEYDAIAARNEAIQGDVDYLGTDEGMEDAARSELGWVHEGEQTVTVAGLPEETQQESSSEKVRKQVIAGSIPAPQTWYSVVLDPFFGYEPETQVKIS